jgi:hypothetical protein
MARQQGLLTEPRDRNRIRRSGRLTQRAPSPVALMMMIDICQRPAGFFGRTPPGNTAVNRRLPAF